MKISRYFPYEYCKSVFEIDYLRLYNKGFRTLILDIDNTLVHHGENATPQVEALFRSIHAIGLQTILLTDNDEARTKRFLKNIDSDYICDAKKPHPQAYQQALKRTHTAASQAVVIGDQIRTDILGANNSGIPSILVHFIKAPNEVWLGWRRYLDFLLLAVWKHTRYHNRLGGISLTKKRSAFQTLKLLFTRKLLFCDINPTCYKISMQKEICKRKIQDLLHPSNFLKEKSKKPLPYVVYSYQGGLIKRGKGIDPTTQYNKAENIAIASRAINGAILHPHEVFSFWRMVGNTTKKNGYKEGRVIECGQLIVGLGGGLCNLGNTLHLLALHSPLTVTEVHYHSDALAADHGKRVPMSAGTSVNYNNIDLRFRNNTKLDFQIFTEVRDETLFAELRCSAPLPHRYEITEEGHHFQKEKDAYYRVSKIYRDTIDVKTGKLLAHDLIRDNHSKVMFDVSEIPAELLQTK